jgi:hypothetical protein
VEQLEVRSLLSTGYSFAPVALLGDPAPGPEGGTFTFDFEPGGLNNKGQVVFTADLDEGAAGGGEGVFLGGKGGLSQIIRFGESAPGGGTFGGFGSFSPDTINDSGDAAFGFGLDPFTSPLGANAGVYRYDHGSGKVTAVVVPGVTPVPGAPGQTFAGAFFAPSLNNRGDLAFAALVPATVGFEAPLGQGVYLASPKGTISKIVSPGDTVASIGTFDQANQPSINSKGGVAFAGHLTTDPATIPEGSTSGVYIKQAGGPIISIAHHGDSLPIPGGGVLDYAYSPVINNRGQVAFVGAVQGTTGPIPGVADVQVVFLYSGGSLTAVATPGQTMPGGGHFVSTSEIGNQVDLNNAGDVAFNAILDTTTHVANGDQGLYVFSHGSLRLVARSGTVIPGVGEIDALDSTGAGEPRSGDLINDHGEVAFAAGLVGGGGALLIATPRGKGNSTVAATSSAVTAPTANPVIQADMPLVSLPLAQIDQDVQELGGGLLTTKKKS